MQSSEGFVFVRPGLNLYFRTVGEGPEILLVPNANWLGEMLHPLASGRTLLFFDPRSRGRSSAVTDPKQLSLDADVEDLETVRRFFGAERVSLLGTSYHAAIAATYALENPERVDRLILSCPITPRIPGEWAQELPPSEVLVYPPGVPRLEELRKAGVDRSDPVAFCRAWFTQFLLPAQMSELPAIERFPVADVASFPNEWPQHSMPLYFQHIVPKMGRWDFRPRLETLAPPLLVIQGTDDLVPVEASREWAAWGRDARFLPIEAAGHHPYIERPDEFFPAVEDFLQGRWPQGAEAIRRAA
ncbi:MAG TPA: alpha/beta hydrolase [Thermoanaerobaculia bacterium]|nr:alpha/beta hydrolase [Thermoanaerobaculia bacterium]